MKNGVGKLFFSILIIDQMLFMLVMEINYQFHTQLMTFKHLSWQFKIKEFYCFSQIKEKIIIC